MTRTKLELHVQHSLTVVPVTFMQPRANVWRKLTVPGLVGSRLLNPAEGSRTSSAHCGHKMCPPLPSRMRACRSPIIICARRYDAAEVEVKVSVAGGRYEVEVTALRPRPMVMSRLLS